MHSIFYDLETTDKNPIGQILNYSFICVDEAFEVIDELSGKVQISRLQLPSPGAILANRTDVLSHQNEAQHTEKEAMAAISDFISRRTAATDERVAFIGYNSTRFDLPYLRTSLIRNGLNPYFGGRLVYRDLLHAARKLSVSGAGFPRGPALAKGGGNRREKEEPPRLSLSLETLTNELGILQGPQSHESRDDVLISISLAKVFKEKFGLDIARYEPYEAADLHRHKGKGMVFYSDFPNYDLSSGGSPARTPMTLLDSDHRYALWIDLDRYRDGLGRGSISWFNQGGSAFFCDMAPCEDSQLKTLAAAALREFSAVNLKNYFQKSSCDIEQDIYRLDISLIDLLRGAIWKNDPELLKKSGNRDARVIYTRYQLRSHKWGGENDDQVRDMLKKYALYRYGGEANISRFCSEKAQPGVYSENFHETLTEYLDQIEAAGKGADSGDLRLLTSLKEFYLGSDIYKVAGAQLLQVRREKIEKAA